MPFGRSTTSIVKRFVQDVSGHFALMTAIIAPVAITLAAIAVDSGSLYVEKRRAQALVDLAAITAAANLHKPHEAAMIAMTDNGVVNISHAGTVPGSDRLTVVPGIYDTSSTTDVFSRFVPSNQGPHNAVRVTYETIGTRFFAGSLIPPPRIAVSAVAGSTTGAAFSVGSRLLSLEGGLVNQLLTGLLGSSISLSVMDYNALLDADVKLLSFLDALALELELTAGTYDKVLNTEVSFGQVARALSKTDGASGGARLAAANLAHQSGGVWGPKLKLSRLIDLGDTGGQLLQAGIDHIGLEVGVLELVTASAIAAGKGKQIALDLRATVPGLLKSTVALAIGEPHRRGCR